MNLPIKVSRIENAVVFEEREPIELVDREGNAKNEIRWSFVSNSNYQSKHPIYNSSDKIEGHLVGGVDNIGYTYSAIYLGNGAFLVARIPWKTRTDSLLLVQPTGRFLLRASLGLKFEVTATHR